MGPCPKSCQVVCNEISGRALQRLCGTADAYFPLGVSSFSSSSLVGDHFCACQNVGGVILLFDFEILLDVCYGRSFDDVDDIRPCCWHDVNQPQRGLFLDQHGMSGLDEIDAQLPCVGRLNGPV